MDNLSTRRLAALETVDAMPQGLRECVHEFGYPIVNMMIMAGVRNPRHIRMIVKECWAGSRQAGQNTSALGALDWLLPNVEPTGRGLIRYLVENSYVIAPICPTNAMIEASMNEVSGHTVRCTKREKHRRRLYAALTAARDDLVNF